MKLVATPSSKVPRACRHCTRTLRGQQLVVLDSQSSGDTILNRLGEFREIRESNERTGIAAHGHPAGTPGAPGVERLRPNEDGLWSDGGERGKTDGFFRRDRPVR